MTLEPLHLDLLFRLLLAALLGGIIGAERELSGKVAGLRTNLLICVGAALITEVSILMPGQSATGTGDPARIAAQIVSGIGFLGAGSILQARGSVIGLTTAATLWVVAAIGMAVGVRAYVQAAGATVMVLGTLVVLRRVEARLMHGRVISRRLSVALDAQPELLDQVRREVIALGLEIEGVDAVPRGDELVAAFTVSGPARRWAQARQKLLEMPGVRRLIET